MKGWLITNGFLQSSKFEELYALLSQAASDENVTLLVKTSTELFAELSSEFSEAEKPDFVLFWDKDYALAKRLEGLGLRLFNGAEAVRACDDKRLTALALAGQVRMPKTMIAPMTFEGVGYTDRAFLDKAAQVLGFPMVVKESFGSFGSQVYLAEDGVSLGEIVDKLGAKSFLLQEFIECSRGRDLRVNVVGGKVLCAMLRENKHDFRSNITGGGRATACEPSPEQAELAIRACNLLGLDFAGVDLLFGEDGTPILCEVNSNPHFKSTLDCTGENLAVAVIRYIKGVLA